MSKHPSDIGSQGNRTGQPKRKVFEFLELDGPIQVMDIGAAAIAEVPIYQVLLDNGLAHLNAFEGDERQIENIEKAYGADATIYRDFLFDGTERTLHLASGPSGMTSLLAPKADALNFFNGFAQIGHIERTAKVKTEKLDDVDGLPFVDFLKMDIQGSELAVLKNGVEKLKNCLAIQIEVSFICLYEEQPTFGDIDVWMRSQGYVPHCFLGIKRWSIAPTIFNNNIMNPGNQLLEADIVYIRDPLKLESLTGEQLKRLAALAHHCFKSYDLCIFVLLELQRRKLVDDTARLKYSAALCQRNPSR